VFIPGKPFQPGIKFAREARAYPSEGSFRCSTLGYAPGLSDKDYTRLESISKDKHSSLMQTCLNYGCKKFYEIGA
jgi:hypothetical protein